MTEDTASGFEYRVVINAEEQYSIWPAFRDIPDGWTATGPTGSKDACLAWIQDNWTDMRPKSTRVAQGG